MNPWNPLPPYARCSIPLFAADCVQRWCSLLVASLLFVLIGFGPAGVSGLPGVESDATIAAPPVQMLEDEFPRGWRFVSTDASVRLEDVWKIGPADGRAAAVLVCSGKPQGYLRTAKSFHNFEFSVDWMYPSDPNGNSGILIHVADKDKIWPDSVQVQLHQPEAGSIFPTGDAKGPKQDSREAPVHGVNEWNHCRIVSRDGQVSVTINDKEIAPVTGFDPTGGAIALQSEGSEIHFRNLRIRELR